MNDNTFIFNRNLCYKTAFYDRVIHHWIMVKVGDQVAISYIAFKDKHYKHIQAVVEKNDPRYDMP